MQLTQFILQSFSSASTKMGYWGTLQRACCIVKKFTQKSHPLEKTSYCSPLTLALRDLWNQPVMTGQRHFLPRLGSLRPVKLDRAYWLRLQAVGYNKGKNVTASMKKLKIK